MSFRSLRLRLLLVLSFVVILAVGLLSFSASRAFSTEFQRYFEDDFLNYERFVSPFIVSKLEEFMNFRRLDCSQSLSNFLECQEKPNAYTKEAITELQHLVEEMSAFSATRIIVADQNGKVIADSNPQQGTHSRKLPVENLSAVFKVNDEPFLVYITVRDEASLGKNRQVLFGSVNRALLVTAISAGGIAILLALMLSRRILRPIGELTRAARRLGRGDLTQRVIATSNDEIGELTQAFNTMAASLSRLEQLRRQMVSDIAHELRTPLSNVRGYLEAIQDGLKQPDHEVIQSLYEEVMLLNRVVDDLQELALAEAGQLHLERKPFSLAQVLAQALTALEPQFRQKDLRVSCQLPADLPLIEADPERIGQVVRNLLINAVTYTPPGGEISVRAREKEAAIEVEVEDTGIGIEPDHIPLIFERFYRVDASRSRATGGAGLGLAIVKQLIQAHGGQVRVKSKVGEGSIFTFTLPLSVSHGTPSP